jgi:hypothetical protein
LQPAAAGSTSRRITATIQAMDLSDLIAPNAPAAQGGHPSPGDGASADEAWRVAHQLGTETAGPLTAALEATSQLQATGRIDRAGLNALHSQIEEARQASMVAQQIARLAGGGIQQHHETLDLRQALHDSMAARESDLLAMGLVIRPSLTVAHVLADATLLSALLNATLDWSRRHARTEVDIRLEAKPWPAHPRLTCRFGHVPADQVHMPSDEPEQRGRPRQHHAAGLDCLRWHLLVQLARTMQWVVQRVDSPADTILTLEFPRTAAVTLEQAAEPASPVTPTDGPKPLASTRVLVIALRRDLQNQINRATAPLGATLDFVSSVDAARAVCQRALPSAIVYESAIYDVAFDTLRTEIRRQCPELAWVEIIEQGEAFEISSFGGLSMARVGRDAIATSLPSALLFELTKGL